MPAIIRFLGYNPLPEVRTLAEQLVRQRTMQGLSREPECELDLTDPERHAQARACTGGHKTRG